MIEIENLNFEYGATQVLHDINLHIKKGAITALVGPNGAGKTTLMRCMVGLEIPSLGRVTVGGIDVSKQPHDVHALSGYLSDFFGLYDNLTVAQNLTYMAQCHGLSGAVLTQRVQEVAGLTGVTHHLEKMAGALSRGYRQRLGVGMTLLHKPQVLLLDEPASGMDPESRVNFSRLILALRDAGYTLLVSSHILAELEDYCTDMLVIREGRVAEHVYLSDHQSNTTTQLLIGVLNLSDAHLKILSEDKDLQNVEKTDENIVRCETACGVEEQHALLKRLLRKNVPIHQFASEQKTLQRAYMELAEASGTSDWNKENTA